MPYSTKASPSKVTIHIGGIIIKVTAGVTPSLTAETVVSTRHRAGDGRFASTSAVEARLAVEAAPKFDVVLVACGLSKIEVIKEVRGLTALDLKGAKDLVEGAPMPVKQNADREEAERIGAALRKAGATVRIAPSGNGQLRAVHASIPSHEED